MRGLFLELDVTFHEMPIQDAVTFTIEGARRAVATDGLVS